VIFLQEKLKGSILPKYEYKRIGKSGHGFTDQTYSQAFKRCLQDFLQKKFEK